MPASEPIPNTSPPLPPTHPLTTQAARLYTHVHPVLVLGLLATSFNAIVANPVSTLHALVYPLAALQAAYCVICLPAAKNEATKPRKAGQSSSSSSSLKQTLSSRITSAILSLLLTLTLTLPLLTTLLVLHGAPLTTHHPATLLLALHLSLLTAPPLFYTHGVNATAWRALVSFNVAGPDEVLCGAAGAAVGAWLGAVPIPLDWDREWQAWPVTVVAGVYGGWAVGKVGGWAVVRGGWSGGRGSEKIE